MVRTLLVASLVFLVALAHGETLLTPAKVMRVTERGLILQVGTEPLAAEDSSKTKYWRARTAAKREDYKGGENVYVRINTKEDPPELRECADEATWKWLESIRKKPQKGTVEKIDSKYVTLKMADGSSFSYRATEKSDVVLKGKAGALSDLSTGQTLWIKGRTLPTLDVWAVLITDVAIAEPKSTQKATEKSEAKPKLKPLEATGTIEGEVLAVYPELKMFDINQGGRTLHIRTSNSTVFVLDGKSAKSVDVQVHFQARVTYKRDKNGRILASRVELSSS